MPVKWLFLCVCLVCSFYTSAEVVFDQSIGNHVNLPITLSGAMQVNANRGATAGNNLFHSFDTFNINSNTQESVTFNAPGTVANIIARVTGGTVSNIDGSLNTFNTDNQSVLAANFWLINPAGFLFGSQASLNLFGAFFASTADSVTFSNGDVFNVNPGSASTLSVADPAGFGFVGTHGSIGFQNAGALGTINPFDIPLNFIGGDIVIENSNIQTALTDINMVSVAGDNTVDASSGVPVVANTSNTGAIRLTASSVSNSGNADLASGNVRLIGRQIDISNSNVTISNISPDTITRSQIHVQAAAGLTVTGDSFITSATTGSEHGADIVIEADTVALDVGAIRTDTSGSGNAGDITLTGANGTQATSVTLTNGAGIATHTSVDPASLVLPGGTGSIEIRANTLVLGSDQDTITGSHITAVSDQSIGDAGSAGSITLTTATTGLTKQAEIAVENGATDVKRSTGDIRLVASGGLVMNDASVIRNQAMVATDSGDIVIDSGQLNLNDSDIKNSALFGAGGGIFIGDANHELDAAVTLDQVSLLNGAQITSGHDISVAGLGAGLGTVGDVVINAAGAMAISGASLARSKNSGVETHTGGTNPGGNVSLTAGTLTVGESGRITTRTTGSGNAGSIDLLATNSIRLQGGAGDTLTRAEIRSDAAKPTFGTGSAGDLRLRAPLVTVNHGNITSNTAGAGNAGNISIEGGSLILESGAALQLQTQDGGSTGDIALSVNLLQMENGAQVLLDTQGTGLVGAIGVNAANVALTGANTGIFSSSSGSDGVGIVAADGGDINLTTPNLTMSDAAVIQATSTGDGDAGTVRFINLNAMDLRNAAINTDAASQSGGNIIIFAENNAVLSLTDSFIRAKAQINGANVTIQSPCLLVLNNSQITGNAVTGNGGAVNVTVCQLVRSNASKVTASSTFGLTGEELTESPVTDLKAVVAALKTEFFDLNSMLNNKCAVDALSGRNSFVVEDLRLLPRSPEQNIQAPDGLAGSSNSGFPLTVAACGFAELPRDTR